MSSNKKNGLVSSAIWYTIGTFLLKGINFFTMPVFTSLLTTSDYGIVTIYATWSAMLSIFIGLGINGTVASAKSNLEDSEYREYLSSTLFLSTISFLVFFIIAIIFQNKIAIITELPSNLIVILVVHSFFSFVVNYVSATFTFDKQPKKYLIVSFVITFINIALSILMVTTLDNDRFIGKIYGEVIAVSIVGIILYIKIVLKGKTFFSLKYWKFCLPIAIPLIFHNISHLVLNQADKIMISKFLSEDDVGIYGVTYTIGAIINILQIAINSAWVAWYFDKLKEGAIQEIKEKAKIYIFIFTSITALFILGVPEVFKIFAAKDYWKGIPLLPIIIVGYYFVFLYTFPVNYEFYMKQSKYIAIGTVIAAILNILINFILIPKLGIMAAGISTLIAYIVLFILHLCIVKYKFKHYDISNRMYIKPIIVLIGVMILFYLLIDMFVIRWILIFIYISIILVILWKYRKKIKKVIQ